MNRRVVVCCPLFWMPFSISGEILARNSSAATALARRIPGNSSHPTVLSIRAVRVACAIGRIILAALLCVVPGIVLAASAMAQDGKPDDLTGLSIEQLLTVEVYTASKFMQKTSEAPASVTLVTAKDIKEYGYRTLADLLRSVRGMNVSYDRNYAYLGMGR